jgi:crotonobetainyl-CoA:carnitine CoA-transferase CaiB-like acyl-CoA transferase
MNSVKIAELGQGTAVPFAGRMFVNFGAEVLKVELGPDGDWTRRRPPLVSVQGQETGALFHYLNAGKRSILLHPEARSCNHLLDEIWNWADGVLIDDTFLGLEGVRARLETRGPQVITCVTPFGRTGPRAGAAATAATMFAMSGETSITPGGLGYEMFPERPPLVARGHVTEIDAGVIATLVTAAALSVPSDDRDTPLVTDVAVYEAVVSNNRWLVTNFDRLEWIETRASNAYAYGGLLPCQDGYFVVQGPAERHWEALIEMMGRPEWALGDELKSHSGRRDHAELIRTGLVEWASDKTKAQLLDLALKHGVPLGGFRDVDEVTTCSQLEFRSFFVQYGRVGTGRIPGLPGGKSPTTMDLAPTLNADVGFFGARNNQRRTKPRETR